MRSLRLVEVAVDGGLSTTAAHAQEMLADAYLAAGIITEGLAIAEDLLAREPGNPVHMARVSQAQNLQRENASKRGAPYSPPMLAHPLHRPSCPSASRPPPDAVSFPC
jgi:hypothetical protein